MRAFTLIEQIFVLVLIGILSTVALMHMPNNTLTMDTQTLKYAILQKKSHALNFKANMDNVDENETVCITLTQEAIKTELNNSKMKYVFKSSVSVDGLSNGNTICFDQYGRPFDGRIDENLSNLCKNNVTITISYKNKENHIIIYKMSGAVE